MHFKLPKAIRDWRVGTNQGRPFFEVELNLVGYDEIILNIISQRHIKQ
jgi:hypothetical protein